MSRPVRLTTARFSVTSILSQAILLAATLVPLALAGCGDADPAADDVVNEDGSRVTDPGFAPEAARE
ncbi:hypothetical protein [Alienimonas chondri]|uniref:Uncharacterized protein n=1 Tax=Alienimonas chondri TaxID=2681879 RepID=A0ABX1VEA3_9PLAN|nr:hypothetical protein [Alienimonas chondri]NNJ25366.1 hypothetical protein [Alienimonas chondri]